MTSKTWVLDIETLGTESNAVILSVALVYFGPTIPLYINEVRKNSILLKLNVEQQIRELKRTTNKDTMDWWAKQDKATQLASLIPRDDDLSPADAMEKLLDFFHSHGGTKNSTIFSRGAFDAIIIESMNRALGNKPLVHYSNYRDIRTFIECMYPESKGGYVAVDKQICPDYDESNMAKHNPLDDCLIDIAQMMGGIYKT